MPCLDVTYASVGGESSTDTEVGGSVGWTTRRDNGFGGWLALDTVFPEEGDKPVILGAAISYRFGG